MSQLIAGFEVLERIGEGGMGVVFRARDPQLDRIVALKLLRHGLENSRLRDRFRQEARAAARLENEHIVTIYSFGEHEGAPFIAMEFVPGLTLAQLIKLGVPLTIVQKLELVEALCDGLGYAHGQEVVHRDIKPSNLIVGVNGVLKILDFGLAKAFRGSGLTHTHSLLGSPNYMSPEQFGDPKTVDHRTDIFAVGAVLYELLTGHQAFPGELIPAMNSILRDDPAPFGELVTNIDPRLEAATRKALRKVPSERFQELRRMQDELATIRHDLIAARTAPTGPPLRQIIAAQVQITGHESREDFSPWHETAPVQPDSALRSAGPRDRRESSHRPSLKRLMPGLRPQSSYRLRALLAAAGCVVLALMFWRSDALGVLTGVEADALPPPVPRPETAGRTGEQVSALRETAEDALANGELEHALVALTAALTLTPGDDETTVQLTHLLRAIRQEFSEALHQFSGEPLDPRVVGDYRAALDLDREARTLMHDGLLLDAAHAFLAAHASLTRVLSRANQIARRAGTPAEPRVEASPPGSDESAAKPTQQGATPHVEESPATQSATANPGDLRSMPARPAPSPRPQDTPDRPAPPATHAPARSVAPDGPAVETESDHERAIRAVLREYEQGYERLDPVAIRRVWPTAPARLERDLDSVRSYHMNLADIRIRVSGDSATVTCIRQIVLQPAVGRQQSANPRSEIILTREAGRWVITDLQ